MFFRRKGFGYLATDFSCSYDNYFQEIHHLILFFFELQSKLVIYCILLTKKEKLFGFSFSEIFKNPSALTRLADGFELKGLLYSLLKLKVMRFTPRSWFPRSLFQGT
jgi:hypothetical protein